MSKPTENGLNYKEYPIETVYEGIYLKGRIRYGSKDYHLYLDEPFKAEKFGGHLMYMIRSRYVTPLDGERCKKPNFDISLNSDEYLIELYKNPKWRIKE